MSACSRSFSYESSSASLSRFSILPPFPSFVFHSISPQIVGISLLVYGKQTLSELVRTCSLTTSHSLSLSLSKSLVKEALLTLLHHNIVEVDVVMVKRRLISTPSQKDEAVRAGGARAKEEEEKVEHRPLFSYYLVLNKILERLHFPRFLSQARSACGHMVLPRYPLLCLSVCSYFILRSTLSLKYRGSWCFRVS